MLRYNVVYDCIIYIYIYIYVYLFIYYEILPYVQYNGDASLENYKYQTFYSIRLYRVGQHLKYVDTNLCAENKGKRQRGQTKFRD